MQDSIETRFRFTDKRVRALSPNPAGARSREKEYSDTELTGLRALVSKNGRKFFYLRLQRHGRKVTRRLGEFGVIGVADARRMAAALRLEMESPASVSTTGSTLGHSASVQAATPKAPAAPAVPTVAEFAPEYMEHAKAGKKSWKDDELRLKAHILPAFGERRLNGIPTGELQRFLDGKRATLKPATINRLHSLLRVFFKAAIRWGHMEKNPMDGIGILKENNRVDRCLSSEEVQRFLRALDDVSSAEDSKDAIKFLLLTGLRKNEALKARWEHVDLDKAELLLPDTKSGKPRRVPLNSKALALLKERREAAQEGAEWVFEGRGPGEPLKDVRRAFEGVLKASGIEDLRVHDLRHTFASTAVNSGVPLDVVQLLLGHADASMTQRYAHHDAGTLRKGSDAVAGAFGDALGE